MSTINRNIWDGLNFERTRSKSAYDYLIEQSKTLAAATGFELTVEVERVDSYLDGTPMVPIALSKLYIVAPKLGNFRRKLFTVVEGKNGANFPVDIYCHLDDKKETDVTDGNFLQTINEIIRRPIVASSILSLYNQSKEIIDRNRLMVDVVTSLGATTISWLATPIYWSQDESKGFVLMDIQGYTFPDPTWGKMLHISSHGDQYSYLEDAVNNYLSKQNNPKTPKDKDLQTILEAIKNETLRWAGY
jgi:hypothetical protein